METASCSSMLHKLRGMPSTSSVPSMSVSTAAPFTSHLSKLESLTFHFLPFSIESVTLASQKPCKLSLMNLCACLLSCFPSHSLQLFSYGTMVQYFQKWIGGGRRGQRGADGVEGERRGRLPEALLCGWPCQIDWWERQACVLGRLGIHPPGSTDTLI